MTPLCSFYKVDGLFPKHKAPEEYEPSDFDDISRLENFAEIVSEIIETLDKRTGGEDIKFERALLSQIFDTDYPNTKKLYHKVLGTEKLDAIMINMFAWSAAHFKD